jgi:co-chaperonin GroES (HSP10)
MDIGIRPFFTRVLIKRNIIKTVGKDNLIHVPQNNQEAKIGLGEIIAVGPDCNPENIKIGDLVLFGRFSTYLLEKDWLEWGGVKLSDDKDAEYLLCNEDDLLGVKIAEKKEETQYVAGQ